MGAAVPESHFPENLPTNPAASCDSRTQKRAASYEKRHHRAAWVETERVMADLSWVDNGSREVQLHALYGAAL